MANEIYHNSATGLNFYACRFQLDGDVFLTDGSADETWGTGGRDADAYDVALTEDGSSGHYVADFDASGNIGAGLYRVTVYQRIGANPADTDPRESQGVIEWNGSAEVTRSAITTAIAAQNDLSAAQVNAEVDAVLADYDGPTKAEMDAGLAAITVDTVAIADAVHDEAVEGTITLRQALRLILSFAAGESSGGGTTRIKYRDQADSKDRIDATVDSRGNRTAVTRDVS